MAQYQLLLPKMGESVAEATIIKWVKNPGDTIEIDDSVLEIATDKVDSEVPSPVAGKLIKQLVNEDEVVQVGTAIALIEINTEETEEDRPVDKPAIELSDKPVEEAKIQDINTIEYIEQLNNHDLKNSTRFYSPLVKSIAAEEGVPLNELDDIHGSGVEGRVTKQDILDYVNKNSGAQKVIPLHFGGEKIQSSSKPAISVSGGEEIIEMDRMRKLISEHMVMSKHTSPHVSSFIEADVTNLVQWRERNKTSFEKREGEKITFTPIFIEAVAKAIRDFPMINVSVKGTQIIKKRDINIGMATSLPSGNLIVPVIKNADQLNLVGLTKTVNDLANRARINKLQPDEVKEGTFTITNIGSFGNVMGTPIINQPQVAILAVGAIKKKPAVIETEFGDMIGIRHMMFLSMSYDHRVVDGSLGGAFIKKVADYLEGWDINREI
ncbi:MAG TPA: dihydrolipoamide acetyltransferase family protein [Sphingobacteriaceae bacterium]|nr:dihydrolipoamide acetyltransferase family protein [Sphingobacteriaceae bacterium]